MLIDMDELAKSLYVRALISSMLSRMNSVGTFLDEEVRHSPQHPRFSSFRSPGSVARLNGIVHPVLIEQLSLRISIRFVVRFRLPVIPLR